MNYAWKELPYPGDEDTLAWDFMFYQLAFNPSIHSENFPGIIEPEQSITFSFSRYFTLNPEEAIYLENKLNTVVHKAFCQLISSDQKVYALDWQHSCYSFYPHQLINPENSRAWEIPILPNGDYYIFIDKNFQFGTFGHPWEQTICFYGETFINLIESDLTRIFGNPMRRNGKHVIV